MSNKKTVGETPVVGDSVFIGFVTLEGQRQKGSAMYPFDAVEAVYSETSKNKKGETVFNVRVKSGDVLAVVKSSKNYWQAIS